MKVNKIGAILKSIRNKYARIREMTETFDIDSKPETCIKVIKQRAVLLSEIEGEKSGLDTFCSQLPDRCQADPGLTKIRNEIQLLISASLALDSAIQDKLIRRIEKVKTEINSLSQNSKVALSYARHSV